MVGTLARLRPFWGYHTDNDAYASQAEMMNRVTRALYLEQFFDLRIKDALKFAAATGRGWVHPIYSRSLAGTGIGAIKFLTYGAPSVLPVQLPSDGDFQRAYAMTILDEIPVYEAHGMYPMFQHRLRPTASRYWYSSDGVRRATSGNILQRIFGKATRPASADALADLLVPMRKTYVIDLSINTTDRPIPMGEPGSTWSYTVPYVGQDIPDGMDASSNHMRYRKANANDARLYPNRRLMISSDNCITYDGPGFDWHGMFPAASFALDAWPWEPAGFSLVRDGYEIQEAIKELERGNMDKARSQLDMALAFDTNAVTATEAKRFDPMQPRARVGYDGSALEGTPFQPVVPPEVLKITPESLALIQHFEQSLDSQMALTDVMALTKMRAVGSMDELEKVVEANGPIVEDMSRSMEPPMRDVGVMLKYLVLQYMNTPRLMQYVGVDGVSAKVFDFDPTSIVPSHMAGENPDNESGKTKLERARLFADNLRFFILPNSLHEITQTVLKLGLIQLKKAGIKIDSQTIAESWSLPNYGKLPGSTIMERWKSEQELDLEFAARMMQIKSALMPDGGQAPASGAKNPEGRPPSGQAPPQLKTKDNGQRATITESK